MSSNAPATGTPSDREHHDRDQEAEQRDGPNQQDRPPHKKSLGAVAKFLNCQFWQHFGRFAGIKTGFLLLPPSTEISPPTASATTIGCVAATDSRAASSQRGPLRSPFDDDWIPRYHIASTQPVPVVADIPRNRGASCR
jgi:hypothetical protein